MTAGRRQSSSMRGYLRIAAIAIGIALLLLLLSHGDATGHTVSLVLLPSPCVLVRIEYMRLGFAPEFPVRRASFQRPPPFDLV